MSGDGTFHALRLAAVHDGTSPAWQSFYPEGLPEDWRLAYYAHQWKDLLFPAAEWALRCRDLGWIGEIPDGMRVYLEPAPRPDGACAALVEALGHRLGGLLEADPARTWPPAVAGRVLRSAPLPKIDGVRTGACFAGAGERALVLEPEAGLGPRQWRALLESLHASMAAGQDAVAFFRVSPAELEQAVTILRLAGLAWKKG